MSQYRYSPLPIEDYRITSLGACEVSSIMEREQKYVVPLWNLFWLSVPGVDALETHAKSERWFLHYKVVNNALASLFREVETDIVLETKLKMHPARFLEWFRREDHQVYDFAYHELGGETWVENVKRRAADAAYRLANTLPPEMQGSNIYPFIQRPRDDTFRDGTSKL